MGRPRQSCAGLKWLLRLHAPRAQESLKQRLELLFSALVMPLLRFVRREVREACPTPDGTAAVACMRLWEALAAPFMGACVRWCVVACGCCSCIVAAPFMGACGGVWWCVAAAAALWPRPLWVRAVVCSGVWLCAAAAWWAPCLHARVPTSL